MFKLQRLLIPEHSIDVKMYAKSVECRSLGVYADSKCILNSYSLVPIQMQLMPELPKHYVSCRWENECYKVNVAKSLSCVPNMKIIEFNQNINIFVTISQSLMQMPKSLMPKKLCWINQRNGGLGA